MEQLEVRLGEPEAQATPPGRAEDRRPLPEAREAYVARIPPQ